MTIDIGVRLAQGTPTIWSLRKSSSKEGAKEASKAMKTEK